jgi:hypothetical protein
MRIEALEARTLLSAVPMTVSVPAVTAAAAGDTVIPFHVQVGGTALDTILGVATKIDTLEQAVDAYLNEIPGWHLTGGIDTTPTYSGSVDGSLDIAANGILRSANVTLTGSADIGATIEGYYGISVLHVGVGVAADLSANVSATASYSVDTNAWNFGGSASLVGYVKGYASATAWPVKGEVYIQGNVNGSAAISSSSGMASASMAVVGTVGADAQLKSLFGGWTTIASVSRNLGSWQGSASFNVGAWLKSEATTVAVANQAATVSMLPAAPLAQAKASALNVGVSTLSTATVSSQPVAAVAQATASVTNVATPVLPAPIATVVANHVATASTQPVAPAISLDASALHQAAITSLMSEESLAA